MKLFEIAELPESRGAYLIFRRLKSILTVGPCLFFSGGGPSGIAGNLANVGTVGSKSLKILSEKF